ncbi:ABC transporter ATP-binding protein [Leucothrix mucor]|uniref:ABC transporter ATP-binding protein n=1 Tax=Leucothrix mucor TaxID=45248 RepID=UPI0003B6AC48|nr:ABC transporter ATP-binding protein [Leucothrix mucor]
MAVNTNGNKVFEPWNDPQKTPLIRFEGVTKRYGDFTAIDNLTLDIYEKEFYALLGPSGCGKTTLLRLLAGFETPTEGRILLGGKDLSKVPPNQRPVNMMFQSYALFPHMSVEKNIGFGLKQEGRSKAEIADRVAEMLKLVQLTEFAKRKPHQLSGGQRQRVALARSLAKNPKLLLLDEPLGALDKKLRERTQFELMNLQESLGVTFMIVTHDQEEAMTVASRIAIMDKGIAVQVDTPAAIYEAPNSRYIADFIGDVNFIETTLSSREGDQLQVASTFKTKFSLESDIQAEIGSTLWLAIRPEKIAISKQQPTDKDNIVQGEVIDIAYSGDTSTYHVKIADGTIVKTLQANQRRLSNREITWEDKVWLSWTNTAAIALAK